MEGASYINEFYAADAICAAYRYHKAFSQHHLLYAVVERGAPKGSYAREAFCLLA